MGLGALFRVGMKTARRSTRNRRDETSVKIGNCAGPVRLQKPYQLQPVVVPQSMQTLQVPFCTMRELPQLGHVLPSYRRSP